MRAPPKLKNLNLFQNGENWVGLVDEFTPAKLSHKREAWRGGASLVALKIDHGLEDDALDVEFKLGTWKRDVVSALGETRLDGTLLRFSGAFQSDETGAVSTVEITVRGRYQEADRGAAKSGEDTEMTVKMNCVYYKEEIDGAVVVEIDALNMVYVENGVDRYAEIRAAIGL